MGDTNGVKELWLQHRAGQDKYTYFLLAVTASAVVFAIQKTDGASFSTQMIPLGGVILCWGVSFYCGCRNLLWVQTSLMANYGLLQLKTGSHPKQPDEPELLQAAVTGVQSALKKNVSKAEVFATWQFCLTILGALLFILWHLLEMYARTTAP